MVTVLRDDYLYNAANQAGQNIANAIMQRAAMNRQRQQEYQLGQDYQGILQSYMSGMNSVPMGMQGLLNIKSPQLQQALIPQLMQQLMPQQPNLLDMAQIANYQSQIQERQANMNKPEPLSPMNVGGKVAFADKHGNVRITEMPYGSPETQKLQAINSGENLLLFNPETGEMKPTPYASSRVPSTTVNVDTKPAPQGEREKIVQLENIKGQAIRAKELWNSSFTGLESWTAPYREKISGAMSANESKFRQNMKSLVKKMYADSGKQLSDKEWERLSGTLPRMETSDNVFQAQLDEWITNLTSELDITRQSLTESGYIAPKLNNKTTNELDAELRKRGLLP